ncbi:MAG: GntR family transcriptional regulator [Planctomycetales bacterium]|nr:GntR family transcriptional regulator [Planctomycetales bacterium]
MVTAQNSERTLLKDRAYVEIKRNIQNGTFVPGRFLSERWLATWLGMSKTPVKAALERLAQEDLVIISPQQGIAVRELSLKDVVDQFEMRRALETFVVGAIAGALNVKQCAGIERNLVGQKSALHRRSLGKFVELDTSFHLLLCDALGNDAISQCLTQQRQKINRVISRVMDTDPGRLKEAISEHEALYRVLKAGRRELAVKMIDQHLNVGKLLLLTSYQ